MALETVFYNEYPAWGTYSGRAEIVEMEIDGPPEQLLPVSIVARLAVVIIEKIRFHAATMLWMRVEADWAPTWKTKYRVSACVYGTPWTLIIMAISAAIIAVGLAITSWKVTELFLEGAEKIGRWPLIAGGVALLGGLIYAASRRKRTA